MSELRGPKGCPWDREQTHESILPQLIEESYEVISAVDDKNYPHLCEELGDLLLHIIFHSQMASEKKNFTIDDVINGITAKLIRRHPHVFGDVKVENAGEVVKNWDEIKAGEKKKHKGESYLDSVPKALPPLLQAYQLTKKASKQGFDWEKTDDVIEKIDEEINEIKEAHSRKNSNEIRNEIGDLFFALVNLCRFLKVQPEEALRQANEKFRKRFKIMEKKIQLKKKNMADMTLKELDRLWDEAKKELSE